MAGDEPVTSPDQRKRGSGKLARAGAVFTIIALLAMLFPKHHGHVEDYWLGGLALLLALILVTDWVLRRNGLRS